MRRTGPLALILILLTALLAWAFLGVLVPIIGPAAGWLSLALTLAAAATLALGLSGRSRIVRGWLEQGRGRAAGWLQQFQIPDQAQGLMQRGSRPLRWLSGATAESSHHPAVLASGVLIAVLVAPLLSRLFGALLWLLVVAGVVAGVLWWRSRSKAAAGQGGAR
jgi:O-antigen ligase